MESPEDRREERWLGALFLTLALLYLIPFWIVHYLPTVDGPCHTYNAWILRQYDHVPLFRQYYQINAEPYPNWIGHGIMALLMLAVPPLVAEKLLASVYALTLLGGRSGTWRARCAPAAAAGSPSWPSRSSSTSCSSSGSTTSR